MNTQDAQNLLAMYFRALKAGLIEHHELPILYTAAENAQKWIAQQVPPHADEPPGEPSTAKQ